MYIFYFNSYDIFFLNLYSCSLRLTITKIIYVTLREKKKVGAIRRKKSNVIRALLYATVPTLLTLLL